MEYRDYYQFLASTKKATQDEIKTTMKLAVKYPDKPGRQRRERTSLLINEVNGSAGRS